MSPPGFGRQPVLLAIGPTNPIPFIHQRILTPIVMECGDGIAAFHKRGAREALTGPAPTQRKLSHPQPPAASVFASLRRDMPRHPKAVTPSPHSISLTVAGPRFA